MPTAFAKFGRLSISKRFYQLASNVEEAHKRVWYSQHFISYMGTTSYVTGSVLRELKEGPLLVSADALNVRVNLNTRKPDPIPDSLLEEKCHIRKPKKLQVPEKFTQPAGVSVFSHIFRITEGHIDMNGHTNISVYRVLLVECIEEAYRLGLFQKKLSTPRVKEMQILYAAESQLGDIIKVDAWQDPDVGDRDALRAIISKSGEPLIYAWVILHDDEEIVTSQL